MTSRNQKFKRILAAASRVALVPLFLGVGAHGAYGVERGDCVVQTAQRLTQAFGGSPSNWGKAAARACLGGTPAQQASNCVMSTAQKMKQAFGKGAVANFVADAAIACSAGTPANFAADCLIKTAERLSKSLGADSTNWTEEAAIACAGGASIQAVGDCVTNAAFDLAKALGAGPSNWGMEAATSCSQMKDCTVVASELMRFGCVSNVPSKTGTATGTAK